MTTSTIPASLPKNMPPRRWVWHSTDESIAAGQTSVLSIIEIFCALGLYGWLAFHFEHQWWLLISAVAAPILLLRSPESKLFGLSLLQGYWEDQEGSIINFSKKRKNLNQYEKLFARATLLITFLLMFYIISIKLSNNFQHPVLIFIYILFMIPTLVIFFIPSSIVLDSRLFYIYQDSTYFFGVLSLDTTQIAFFLFIFPQLLTTIDFKQAQGIFFRCFFIRIWSNTRHLYQGITNLPKNWRETLFAIDFTHYPELIPDAKKISHELDSKYILNELFSKNGFRRKFNSTFILIFWYPPAQIWRWSLKATLWLWFPLTLLLRPPFEGKNLDEVRDITAFRITTNKWLTFVALLIAIWLGSSYLPEIKTWVETLSDTISKPALKLLEITPPSLGLRQIALWLCCAIAGLLWLSTLKPQTMHKKILEEEDAIHSGIPEARLHLFRQRAHNLERIYTIQVVSFIFLSYSFLLYFAYQWYPQETLHFIPTWLLNYL